MATDRVISGASPRAAFLGRPVAFFVIFFSLYMLTWAGHYTTGDGARKVAWAKAILLNQPHAVYSRYGIGHTLIALPGLAAAELIRHATGIRSEAALYTLLFILNGAFFLYLAALYFIPRYGVNKTWLILSLMGFCTWWWPYTKMDFSEPLVATLFLAGFLLIKSNRPILGMCVAGYIILIRPDAAVIIAILVLWRIWTVRRLEMSLLLISAAYVGLNAYTNYLRWGSPLTSGYAGETFSTPLLVGLYGMLFSSGKSVFLFSPLLILSLAGFSRFWRRHREDALLFSAVFVSELLLFSKWWSWPGDDAWGSRFMLPSAMLLCVPAVEMLNRRWLVGAVAAVGFLVQLPAVVVSGETYMESLHYLRVERNLVYVEGPPNRVDFDTMRFNPEYSQVRAQWMLAEVMLGFEPKDDVLYSAMREAGWSGKVVPDLLWVQVWSSHVH